MSYLTFLDKELREAAKIALSYYGNVHATTKPGDNNQVLTEADLAIGKYLVSAVRKNYPDYNVIDEEAGVIDNGSRYTWVIDPVEATANFAIGTADWGIMIGLLDEVTPIAGGIIAPVHDRLYLAQKGKGATCNGQGIHITKEERLLKTLVSCSLGGHQDDPERTIQECRMLADILLAARNMRNSDCEAVDSMYVAEGRYGGRINMTSKIWDNVGPQIIAEEAGALWTDAYGTPIDYSEPTKRTTQNFTFCVASPTLHSQLTAITKQHRQAIQR
ncbi:MAG TPA: inositol monophosphatase [Verrucomicrobiae bacterium]|nr:inositol monophosphatase [Verrucomicrobiae bacterium]